MIFRGLASWESVYYYFNKWKNEGIIEELLDKLRSKIRIMSGWDGYCLLSKCQHFVSCGF
ncbi:hypothetical protein [uncultured Bacteroides sp.]|uniref:hypothetical protein n=1 Tax=uncultured Bacteroides sp. TaxID=162156 RepID=UPI00280B463A|nr:hypothetical protein [uncultured Bacteroides sp.]